MERRNFQGVLNILSFNRHFYIYGILVLVLLMFVMQYFNLPQLFKMVVIGGFLYGLIMPLIISAYVYDFSGFYNFDWVNDAVHNKKEISQIVNINAGFDETSFIIEKQFPNSQIQVFDFYDADRHTEPAIVRARKVSLVYPNTSSIESYRIPMEDGSTDIVFLVSAAHEIRSSTEKVDFLKETKRICKPNGKIVMVEHLRDLPNFLAFTIGFTHFFSRETWKNAFKKAGFSTFEEVKFTPFMSIFTCKP